MTLVPWHGVEPERYVPAREFVQIVQQGFTPKRAPVLTRFSLWRQTLIWQNLEHDNRNIVDGFIERMRGESGVSRVPWGYYQKQSGGGSGTPSVNGAHSAGATNIATQNWSGTSPYLRAQDMVAFEFNIGGETISTLHRCVAGVTSGDTTMRIWPPARFDLNDAKPIYFLDRLPPGNTTSYLELVMAYVDPSSLESEAFPSKPGEHYGKPAPHTFIEAIQDVY